MPESPKDNIGSPITEVIEQVRKQVDKGLDTWELKAPIELELNAIVSEERGGGINFKIIKYGKSVETEQRQKIKFSIGPKSEAEQEDKKARIEEAKARIEKAKVIQYRPFDAVFTDSKLI
jgi:hypothetical protein